MLKVLVLFSNPPGCGTHLRLDKEDRILNSLAKRFSGNVVLERQHASEIDDIHSLLLGSNYNIIHFSGHGSTDGIVLDKSDLDEDGELVSANRLQGLLSIPDEGPTLAVFLSCYSNSSLPALVQSAPFVISAVDSIDDDCCLEFVAAFYERLFDGYAIQNSYEFAVRMLNSKRVDASNLRLDRRQLIERDGSRFVESTPDSKRDSILVNLDLVASTLGAFEMPEEELIHLIARKLHVHRWIFDVPRERCLIPIGKMLFGEFSWENADDVVSCTQLLRVRLDVPPLHLETWHRLLLLYNDLASSEYRIITDPGAEHSKSTLLRAINLFDHYVKRYFLSAKKDIEEIGLSECLPYVGFVRTHCEVAKDQYELERYPQALKALEEALTNLHELVDALRPAGN